MAIPDKARPARRRWLRWWPLALILAAMVVFYASGLSSALSLQTVIREHARLEAAVHQHLVPAVAAYLVVYVVAVALSFPGASFLTIAGGFLFGMVGGSILTVLAATVGAALVFLAARTSVGAALRARAGRFTQRLAEGFEEDAFHYLLFLRLVPLFPFWLVNVAPALFSVRLGTYLSATAIGIVPGTIAYAALGDGLGGLIEAQEAARPGCVEAGTCQVDLAALATPKLGVALVLLSLAALIPVALKRWRATRGRRT
ncbi:TVP38/TMEM64 family protein [Acuticoccus mangrovi]|uniref:TVP38/TMEM64 family membrane protein n=1 Tax=Acuticoccus mangrovi TaxID=2796142 RepID=A0A934MFX5_9HYPH|nr:TVP38/TMEM64 family protein [Acuticoccus mangrovi]MBJ3775390.1 TVP38/TMEM64 family protein [Acuticoccus mangrovi]